MFKLFHVRENMVFLSVCLDCFITHWPPVPSILLQWCNVILFMDGCHSVVHIFSLSIHSSVALVILYLGYYEQCCRVHGAAGVSAICWWHLLWSCVPDMGQLDHVIELVRFSWDLHIVQDYGDTYRACRCIFPSALISLWGLHLSSAYIHSAGICWEHSQEPINVNCLHFSLSSFPWLLNHHEL